MKEHYVLIGKTDRDEWVVLGVFDNHTDLLNYKSELIKEQYEYLKKDYECKNWKHPSMPLVLQWVSEEKDPNFILAQCTAPQKPKDIVLYEYLEVWCQQRNNDKNRTLNRLSKQSVAIYWSPDNVNDDCRS